MKKKISLISQITILLISALIVVGAITGFQFQGIVKVAVDEIKKGFSTTTFGLAHSIEAQFYERYGDVQTFAGNPIFSGNDRAEMAQALNEYAKNYGIYDAIVILDLSGRYVASNTTMPSGIKIGVERLREANFIASDWFKNTIVSKWTEDKEHGFTGTFVGAPEFSSAMEHATKTQWYGNVFSTIIRDEKGDPFRVIANFANFKWVETEFRSTYQQLKVQGFQSAEVALLNQEGTLLTEFDPSAFDAGQTPSANRNPEVVSKLNLVKVGVTAAEKLVRGEGGIVESFHARKKVDQVVGFAPLNNDKMVRSLGWGVMVRTTKKEMLSGIYKSVFQFYLTLGGSMLVLAMASFFYLRRFGKKFEQICGVLTNSVANTMKTGESLNVASNDLAAASGEQASAIQESVSALSQISSMIAQTVESTKRSLKSSDDVTERTKVGSEIMQKMKSAMTSIEASNASLQDIGLIIEDIHSKTGVINDIVFKTQLLSFNASIEAARAGQYGKGFAVVAEEVGNLAQMSGNAAGEIEKLLTDSQKKVGQTLDSIRQRVSEGNIVCEESVRTFDEISGSVQQISEQIKNIAEASEQQDVGIVQTQKAMEQLDIASRKNYESAQNTKKSSDSLSLTTETLKSTTGDLGLIVFGFTEMGARPSPSVLLDKNQAGPPEEASPAAPMNLGRIPSDVTADDSSFKKAA